MEAWKEKLEKGTQGFMWQMFWKGHQKGNPEQLEEFCQMLIRMTRQKTAGQRETPGDLNWDNMYMLYNQIAIEATCLVLDSKFDKVKELFRDEEATG